MHLQLLHKRLHLLSQQSASHTNTARATTAKHAKHADVQTRQTGSVLCCCCQGQFSALMRYGYLHHAHACGGCTYTATQHKTNAKPASKPSSERCSACKHNYCMAHISRLSASSADRAVALHCSRPEGANTLPAMTVPTQALQHISRRPQHTTRSNNARGWHQLHSCSCCFDPWGDKPPSFAASAL